MHVVHQASKVTPLKINMEPQKWRFGRWCSFSMGWFLGSMFIFRGWKIPTCYFPGLKTWLVLLFWISGSFFLQKCHHLSQQKHHSNGPRLRWCSNSQSTFHFWTIPTLDLPSETRMIRMFSMGRKEKKWIKKWHENESTLNEWLKIIQVIYQFLVTFPLSKSHENQLKLGKFQDMFFPRYSCNMTHN